MREIYLVSHLSDSVSPRVANRFSIQQQITFHAGEDVNIQLTVPDLPDGAIACATMGVKKWCGNEIPKESDPMFLFKEANNDNKTFSFTVSNAETEVEGGDYWFVIQLTFENGKKQTVVNQNAFIKSDSLNPDTPFYPTIEQIKEWTNKMNEAVARATEESAEAAKSAQSAASSAGVATQAKDAAVQAKKDAAQSASEANDNSALSADYAAAANTSAMNAETSAQASEQSNLSSLAFSQQSGSFAQDAGNHAQSALREADRATTEADRAQGRVMTQAEFDALPEHEKSGAIDTI